MLIVPCEAIDAGDTFGTLITGYTNNTTCVFKYESTFEKLKKYFEEQKQLHEKK